MVVRAPHFQILQNPSLLDRTRFGGIVAVGGYVSVVLVISSRSFRFGHFGGFGGFAGFVLVV